MELSCPGCATVQVVPDDHLPPEGTRARCASCQAVSIYYRGGLVADDPTPSKEVPAARATPPLGTPAAVGKAREVAPSGPWHLHRNGKEEGPFDLSQLKTRIREGTLAAEDLAFAPGATDWTRAGDIPGLRRYFALKSAGHAPAALPAQAPKGGGMAACNRHPANRGRWLCSACGDLSCDECVIAQEMRRVVVRQCPQCKKAVTELVPTKVIKPFWQDVPTLLAYPFKGLGWMAFIILPLLGVISVVASAAPVYGSAGKWFARLTVYAYHLYVIRATTTGGRSLPNLGKVENYKDELLTPASKAAFISLVLTLPATIWAYTKLNPATFQHQMAVAMAEDATEAREENDKREAERAASGKSEEQARAEMLAKYQEAMQSGGYDAPPPEDVDFDFIFGEQREKRDYVNEEREARLAEDRARVSLREKQAVFWALVVVGLGLHPIYLIVVALFNTVGPLFQPQVIFKVLGEIKVEYGWCMLFCGACLVGMTLVNAPLAGIPFLGKWIVNPATYYFSLICFHVMGRTAELAEQKIDWA